MTVIDPADLEDLNAVRSLLASGLADVRLIIADMRTDEARRAWLETPAQKFESALHLLDRKLDALEPEE